MDEAQIGFVQLETFSVDVPPVGTPVAIRTKSDEILIGVGPALRPRDNVMNVHLDMSAGRNRAAMARLDQYAAAHVSR